jgi:hypothetical protein
MAANAATKHAAAGLAMINTIVSRLKKLMIALEPAPEQI